MDRRQFISNGGLGLLAFTVGGTTVLMSPRQARARALALRVLSNSEALLLEALGEVLVPGAAVAGIAHYVDHQLAAPAEESLLLARYADIPPPYLPLYQGMLAAIDGAAQAAHQVGFAELTHERQYEFVAALATGQADGWQGPPASLAYFLLRNDAVDVVYGTQEGFAKLGVPYMPHIVPPTPW